MSTLRFVVGFSLLFALAGSLPAENKNPAKSPADVAAEQFFKLRDDSDAKPSPARFQKVITAGVGFITQNPTYPRTGAVIAALATFGSTIKDKNLAALRASWLPTLKVEIVNQRHNDRLDDDGHAAVAALDAAAAGADAREQYDRPTIENFRDKIDTLAALPKGANFLEAQERDYLSVLKMGNPRTFEAYAQKLAGHSDPKIAAVARDELNLLEIGKQPYELKFTALDGREVDFAQLRGKVVLLSFWSTTSDKAAEEQAALPVFYDVYHRRGFEIISVACDKEEDRAKLTKFVKKNNISWPQYFDGKELKNEVGEKLNVRTLPVAFLFDSKGMLVGGKPVVMDQLNVTVKRLLGIK
jgi:peroxiredoxin